MNSSNKQISVTDDVSTGMKKATREIAEKYQRGQGGSDVSVDDTFGTTNKEKYAQEQQEKKQNKETSHKNKESQEKDKSTKNDDEDDDEQDGDGDEDYELHKIREARMINKNLAHDVSPCDIATENTEIHTVTEATKPKSRHGKEYNQRKRKRETTQAQRLKAKEQKVIASTHTSTNTTSSSTTETTTTPAPRKCTLWHPLKLRVMMDSYFAALDAKINASDCPIDWVEIVKQVDAACGVTDGKGVTVEQCKEKIRWIRLAGELIPPADSNTQALESSLKALIIRESGPVTRLRAETLNAELKECPVEANADGTTVDVEGDDEDEEQISSIRFEEVEDSSDTTEKIVPANLRASVETLTKWKVAYDGNSVVTQYKAQTPFKSVRKKASMTQSALQQTPARIQWNPTSGVRSKAARSTRKDYYLSPDLRMVLQYRKETEDEVDALCIQLRLAPHSELHHVADLSKQHFYQLELGAKRALQTLQRVSSTTRTATPEALLAYERVALHLLYLISVDMYELTDETLYNQYITGNVRSVNRLVERWEAAVDDCRCPALSEHLLTFVKFLADRVKEISMVFDKRVGGESDEDEEEEDAAITGDSRLAVDKAQCSSPAPSTFGGGYESDQEVDEAEIIRVKLRQEREQREWEDRQTEGLLIDFQPTAAQRGHLEKAPNFSLLLDNLSSTFDALSELTHQADSDKQEQLFDAHREAFDALDVFSTQTVSHDVDADCRLRLASRWLLTTMSPVTHTYLEFELEDLKCELQRAFHRECAKRRQDAETALFESHNQYLLRQKAARDQLELQEKEQKQTAESDHDHNLNCEEKEEQRDGELQSVSEEEKEVEESVTEINTRLNTQLFLDEPSVPEPENQVQMKLRMKDEVKEVS